METPIDIAIKATERIASAPSEKGSKKKKPVSLRVKVLSLVHEANKNIADKRKVVPNDALTVMSRALEELSSLPPSSKELGVLREVTRFISLSQKTHYDKDYVKHTDLLTSGHPLSMRNSGMKEDELISHYADWLSADPDVDDDARHLVYAAFSAPLDSIERKHALSRLRALRASAVPSYFRIDHEISALVAAFFDGNSSAARRARVALQWRDRYGRWIEMGRGLNFKVRLNDGSVVSVPGIHVGVDPSKITGTTPITRESSQGLVQVSGSDYLPDGIYSVSSGSAEKVKARLSEEILREAGVSPRPVRRKAYFNEDVLEVDDLKKGRLDTPTGWVQAEFSDVVEKAQALRDRIPEQRRDFYSDDLAFYRSDDDYVVSRTKDDDNYLLWRTDSDGKVTTVVGEGNNWADMNRLASADEADYDKEKKGQESRAGDPEKGYLLRQEREQAQKRLEVNKETERKEEIAESGKDVAGRDVPESWEASINYDRVFPSLEYEKKLYGENIRREDAVIANVKEDGRIDVGARFEWYGNDIDSWDKTDEAANKTLERINLFRSQDGLPPLSFESTEEDTQSSAGERLRLAPQSVKDILASQDTYVSDERAEEIVDMIDAEDLVDWSEATESEIKSAIDDVLELERQSSSQEEDGPDEPPTPPSGGGGTPPKSTEP